MRGSKKIKLLDEQYEIVDKISKDVGFNKNELGQGIFEMGMAFIIMTRKGKLEGAIEVFNKQMEEDPKLRRACERIEFFYDKG